MQGSPLDIFDEKGTSIEQYGYDEFGNDLYENADRIQPFGYTGYMRDFNAETLYAKAREYMPEVGRFTAHDIRAGYVDVPLSQKRKYDTDAGRTYHSEDLSIWKYKSPGGSSRFHRTEKSSVWLSCFRSTN